VAIDPLLDFGGCHFDLQSVSAAAELWPREDLVEQIGADLVEHVTKELDAEGFEDDVITEPAPVGLEEVEKISDRVSV
jgi:hypothetical protein